MTCGACAPEMFRKSDGARVFGYLVAPTMDMATLWARKLYFLGAEGVFSDMPKGNLRHRPGWRILNKILHPGDQLLLLDTKALGSKPEYVRRNQRKLEDQGIRVAFVVTDFFEGHPP